MSGNVNVELLVRFEELRVALQGCADANERVRLISNFVAGENQNWERAELEFQRVRDQVSDDELIARARAAPDMGGATLAELMRCAGAERSAEAEYERGEDFRSALSLGMFAFLAVVQGVLAFFELRDGGLVGKVIGLSFGALANVVIGVFVAASWLRDVRKRVQREKSRAEADSALKSPINLTE